MTCHRRLLLLSVLSACVTGCGGRSPLDAEDFDSQIDGGNPFETGGAWAAGGFHIAGAVGTGGRGLGGFKATGGRATGGRATGGYRPIATGGYIFMTGGARPTGGRTATGGFTATGGVTTGGTRPLGGTSGFGGMGGVKVTGGTTGFGGAKLTGGTTSSSGGSTGTGGKGGSNPTGGAPNGGTRPTGGFTATGGITGAGGTTATGGTIATGGTTSTGGTVGTGGSSACPIFTLPTEDLIDDLDDGNAAIPEVNGRRGSWSDQLIDTNGATLVPDPAGPFFVTDTGDICRKYAVFVKGMTSIDPGSGANFGFSLGSYNASAYTGLSFWARIEAGTDPPVRVAFPDGDTDPRGAICSTSTSDPTLTCWSHFGRRLTLTSTWTKYTIPFSSLTQDPWGYQAPTFNPSVLYSVTFTIGDTATFAIWIDNVAFTR